MAEIHINPFKVKEYIIQLQQIQTNCKKSAFIILKHYQNLKSIGMMKNIKSSKSPFQKLTIKL